MHNELLQKMQQKLPKQDYLYNCSGGSHWERFNLPLPYTWLDPLSSFFICRYVGRSCLFSVGSLFSVSGGLCLLSTLRGKSESPLLSAAAVVGWGYAAVAAEVWVSSLSPLVADSSFLLLVFINSVEGFSALNWPDFDADAADNSPEEVERRISGIWGFKGKQTNALFLNRSRNGVRCGAPLPTECRGSRKKSEKCLFGGFSRNKHNKITRNILIWTPGNTHRKGNPRRHRPNPQGSRPLRWWEQRERRKEK